MQGRGPGVEQPVGADTGVSRGKLANLAGAYTTLLATYVQAALCTHQPRHVPAAADGRQINLLWYFSLLSNQF